jgi:RNA-directed DNA polymerase
MFRTRELSAVEVAYLGSLRNDMRGVPQEVSDGAAYYATTLMERGFPVLFDRPHISFVTGTPLQVLATMVARPAEFYSPFRIPKRSGGSRLIAAPTISLKIVQRWIQRHILDALELSSACHGFMPGHSIVSNAAPHVDNEVVLKLDIRDFFESVSRDRVFRIFRRLGYARPVARALTSLTTFRGALPQGAPTSPMLANAVAEELDVRLTAYAGELGLKYTRYADDLTFSGSALRSPHTRRGIDAIIRAERFRPHDDKARYLGQHQRQIVTGVVVNERLNAPRRLRRRLRQEVYYLRRFGVEEHLRARGITHSRYKEHMYGRVYALNQLRPEEATRLLEELDQVDWPY